MTSSGVASSAVVGHVMRIGSFSRWRGGSAGTRRQRPQLAGVGEPLVRAAVVVVAVHRRVELHRAHHIKHSPTPTREAGVSAIAVTLPANILRRLAQDL